jgi:ABC-type lipoprotein release transport system permease subunit
VPSKVFLFEVRGIDPITSGWLIALTTITALLAAYVPAHRAQRIELMAVLRYD